MPILRRLGALLPIVASASAGIAISAALPTGSGPMGIERMIQTGGDGSGRTALWSDTFRVSLERPSLGFGDGQVIFSVPVAERSEVLHPHNFPLQWFHAWGLAGMMLLACISVLLACRLLPALRSSIEAIPLALGVITLLVFSLYDGTLYHVQASATFFALMGMMLAEHRARTT